MKIELPTEYPIDYSKLENKRYYNQNNKPILSSILLSASKYYCMYCGKSLLNESDPVFHMEHSIDKGGNENQGIKDTILTHCKFNFSVSCPYCNTVCKKTIEKVDVKDVESSKTCLSKTCVAMCSKYQALRKEYIEKNAIIIQPQGVVSDQGQRLKIYYDLFQNIYEPDNEITKAGDLFLIHNHIRRFQLNGMRFSECIIDLCADIVALFENGVSDRLEIFRFLKSKRYTNIIAEQFIGYCENELVDISSERLAELCRLIVILNAAD